jgi:hypothetical protein
MLLFLFSSLLSLFWCSHPLLQLHTHNLKHTHKDKRKKEKAKPKKEQKD